MNTPMKSEREYTQAELDALVDALPVGGHMMVRCETRGARQVGIRITEGSAYRAERVSTGRALVIHDNCGAEKYIGLGWASPFFLPCDYHAERRGETARWLPADEA